MNWTMNCAMNRTINYAICDKLRDELNDNLQINHRKNVIKQKLIDISILCNRFFEICTFFITLRVCLFIKFHFRCFLSKSNIFQSIRQTFEMQNSKNTILYLTKFNFIWFNFKNIQINEIMKTICNSTKIDKQIICLMFLILKILC